MGAGYLGGFWPGAYSPGGDAPDEAPTFTIIGPIRHFGEQVTFLEPEASVTFIRPRHDIAFSDPDADG